MLQHKGVASMAKRQSAVEPQLPQEHIHCEFLSTSKNAVLVIKCCTVTICTMLGNLDFEIQEIFVCGIRNPGLWDPEYSSKDLESH